MDFKNIRIMVLNHQKLTPTIVNKWIKFLELAQLIGKSVGYLHKYWWKCNKPNG